jgi:integrase
MEELQNPVKLAAKPKLSKGRERRLEDGEEEKLLNHSNNNFKQVILFALETAMRREEIATLEWKNVNFEKRYAFLPETKNGESRSVPLSTRALEILKKIKENHIKYMNLINQELVFGMSVNQITNNMQKACKGAGIENLHFHDLRHEATSRFFENTDLDIMEIRAITGHKTLQMLVRYTHLRTARLADRLAGAGRAGNFAA